jgi:hypothetical protein
VADDIMDESITRRGQPCWYRKPNVKMIAINDAFLLEAFVFQILKKHFRSEPFYLDLVETFHDVRTSMRRAGSLMPRTQRNGLVLLGCPGRLPHGDRAAAGPDVAASGWRSGPGPLYC